jgi:hypothetical protein
MLSAYSDKKLLEFADALKDTEGKVPNGALSNDAFSFDYGTNSATALEDGGAELEPEDEPAAAAFELPFSVPPSMEGRGPRTLQQHQVLLICNSVQDVAFGSARVQTTHNTHSYSSHAL